MDAIVVGCNVSSQPQHNNVNGQIKLHWAVAHVAGSVCQGSSTPISPSPMAAREPPLQISKWALWAHCKCGDTTATCATAKCNLIPPFTSLCCGCEETLQPTTIASISPSPMAAREPPLEMVKWALWVHSKCGKTGNATATPGTSLVFENSLFRDNIRIMMTKH